MRWISVALVVLSAACIDNSIVPEVVSYEVTYGECVGACRFTLTADASEVQLEVGDWGGKAVLVTRVSHLTEEGLEAWDEGRKGLYDLPVESGCPGCDDGGVVELTIFLAELDETRVHRWEEGAPPQDASDFDGVASEVMDALARCQISGLIEDVGDCLPL